MQRRNFKQQFNIDVENFLSLPCHVYWKNKKGVILGCNDNQAKNVGFKKGDDLVGKTDFELCWKKEAVIYKENDLEVIYSKTPKLIEEPVRLFDGHVGKAMAYKMPLCDHKGEIIGVFGLSTIVALEKSETHFFTFQNSVLKDEPTKNIGFFENIKLPKRQKECVYHLVRGMTAKQIAKELDLSPRTVEYYIEKAKNRLLCNSRSELIAKIVGTRLMNLS